MRVRNRVERGDFLRRERGRGSCSDAGIAVTGKKLVTGLLQVVQMAMKRLRETIPLPQKGIVPAAHCSDFIRRVIEPAQQFIFNPVRFSTSVSLASL